MNIEDCHLQVYFFNYLLMKYPVLDEIYKEYVVTNYLIIPLVGVIIKLSVLIINNYRGIILVNQILISVLIITIMNIYSSKIVKDLMV